VLARDPLDLGGRMDERAKRAAAEGEPEMARRTPAPMRAFAAGYVTARTLAARSAVGARRRSRNG
jgi:hypothetical protein